MLLPSSSLEANSTEDKLKIARHELHVHLSNISNQLQAPSLPEIEILHAAPPSYINSSFNNETIIQAFERGELYRCKCTFQIVTVSQFLSDRQFNNSNSDIGGVSLHEEDDNDLMYVTREDGKLLSLPNGIFPSANIQIRRAMTDFIECLNRRKFRRETFSSSYKFESIRNNITSVTFVTSWKNENPWFRFTCRGDCLVTLHYGPPGLPREDASDDTTLQLWKDDAMMLCDQCLFTSITGRSKGVKTSVSGTICNQSNHNLDEAINDEGIIHDDLWLALKRVPTNTDSELRETTIQSVSLVPPNQLQCKSDFETNGSQLHEVCIQYQKPATAFQHPNAGVMLTSLHWILHILAKIASETAAAAASKSSSALSAGGLNTSETTRRPRLLEMYCGCGAHTIPLAKSELLSEIVAVELDERLVNACRNNCRRNNCLKDEREEGESVDSLEQSSSDYYCRTLVQVFKGDAGEWADKTLRRQKREHNQKAGQSSSKQMTGGYNKFDILLVDPPREGLSSTVCDMALEGTFTHVIYISCGRRALLRDLTTLCSGEGGFDVVDLAVIDLFPGTDAVESLVHLKRVEVK